MLKQLRDQTWNADVTPKVSVFNWAFNHCDFIRQSIESILDQRTNFRVEIIIHDDASTDGTAEIIAEYAERFPWLFRNVMHAENQYSKGHCLLKPLLVHPRGEYVALTHGDDFWIDADKLQKQAALLDLRKDVVLVGHRFSLASKESSHTGHDSSHEQETGELEDILLRNYVHTATAMFRNGLLTNDQLVSPPDAGDWFIWVQLAKTGKIAFINEVMSAYRIHQGGICSGMDIKNRVKSVRKSIDRLHKDFGRKYHAIKQKSISDYELRSSLCTLSEAPSFSTLLLSRSLARTPGFTLWHPLTRQILKSFVQLTREKMSPTDFCRKWYFKGRSLGSRIKRVLLKKEIQK